MSYHDLGQGTVRMRKAFETDTCKGGGHGLGSWKVYTHLGGRYSLRFTFDQFLPVLDMLRNEKPIFVVDQSGDRVAALSTSPEPIGEEEGIG